MEVLIFGVLCSNYSIGLFFMVAVFYVQFGGGGRGGGRDDFEAPSNHTSYAHVTNSGSGFGGSTAAAGNNDDMWD